MKNQVVLELATTKWARHFFAQKKDSSLLSCVYYRKLNAVTVNILYVLPPMYECIDSLGETRVFPRLMPIRVIGKLKLMKKIEKRQSLQVFMDFTNSLERLSGFEMLPVQFNEPWTLYFFLLGGTPLLSTSMTFLFFQKHRGTDATR